jgi:hypothetical protein
MPLSATVAATSGGCRHQSAVQLEPPSPPEPLPLELLEPPDVLELPLLLLLLPLVLLLPLLPVVPLLLLLPLAPLLLPLPVVPLLLVLPLLLALVPPLLLPEPPLPELLPLPVSEPDPPPHAPATLPAIRTIAVTPRPDSETLFVTMFGSFVSVKWAQYPAVAHLVTSALRGQARPRSKSDSSHA